MLLDTLKLLTIAAVVTASPEVLADKGKTAAQSKPAALPLNRCTEKQHKLVDIQNDASGFYCDCKKGKVTCVRTGVMPKITDKDSWPFP